MEWYEILISVLTGLCTAIPLVISLVNYVKQAVKEKNWADLLELVTNLMKEAEPMFEDGASRKSWVLMAVKASADTINYDIDMDQVSKLIDDLCALSNVVNAPEAKVEEVKE